MKNERNVAAIVDGSQNLIGKLACIFFGIVIPKRQIRICISARWRFNSLFSTETALAFQLVVSVTLAISIILKQGAQLAGTEVTSHIYFLVDNARRKSLFVSLTLKNLLLNRASLNYKKVLKGKLK
jgi:hypothetical protein